MLLLENNEVHNGTSYYMCLCFYNNMPHALIKGCIIPHGENASRNLSVKMHLHTLFTHHFLDVFH